MSENALSYLNNLGLHTVIPGLERIRTILSELGNPERKVPGILIGGTNGKGSVASMVSSILKESGYKTGLYTSPHLVNINERISINGELINDDDLTDCIERVRQAAEMNRIEPSYFEVITACAYLYFSEMENDFNVLEVGMGGRWDATNVIDPLVTVITNISKDHTEYLGETIEKIAAEKACLIHPGRPVVTGAENGALSVINKTATENSSPLCILGKDFHLKESHTYISYKGSRWNIDSINLALRGVYQRDNAALAIKTIELLMESGLIDTREETLVKGLSLASWPGRFEVVREHPPLILDSAHNEGAARALVESLRSSYPDQKFTFLIGMLSDKLHSEFFSAISEIAQKIIITKVPSERTEEPTKLSEEAMSFVENIIITDDYSDAYGYLLHSGDPACVCGSLYLIGAIREILKHT